MWKIRQSNRFEKQYAKLHPSIKKKYEKQINLLLQDFYHPSLHTKKMDEINWEARVDYHYRFTFEIEGETLHLLTIGMHDEGLGKK